ncbi:DUF6020 family protein [Kitasatospora sp. NPDC049258]|uniref:DUF6020 family protein n=1 Tax=Kitasatospora sp. NPDC049258 TaxID=3155394 RepID=UPI0034480B31
MTGDTMLERPPGTGGPGLRERAVAQHRRVRPSRRMPLAVAALCQVVLLLWWLAAYPAFVSYDSVMYVWQVTDPGYWTADHSAFYDAIILWSLKLTDSVAPVVLLQTVGMSLGLGYAVSALARLGARARWSAPVALALVVLPPTGTFVVFLWKDVPFTICGVFLFAAGLRLLSRKLDGSIGRGGRALRLDLAVFFLSMLGLGLFRNSSYGLMLVVATLLLAAVPLVRRRIALLTAVALAIPLFLNLWAYSAIWGIHRPPAYMVYSLNYDDLAVAYHRDPAAFSTEDKAVLAAVAPLTTWDTAGYQCFSIDPLTNWGEGWDRHQAAAHSDELVSMWSRIALDHPDYVVDARLCRGHIAWAIWGAPAARAGDTVVQSPKASPDLFGFTAPGGDLEHSRYADTLRPHPVAQPMLRAAIWLHDAFRAPQLDWLFWRGAVWCYLGYAALAVYARRRGSFAVVAVGGAVLLGLQLNLIVANAAPHFRYMAVALFVGPLLLPLLAAGRDGDRR